MKTLTDRIAPYFPWLGLLLIIAGAIAYLVTRRFDLVTNLLFGGGALLLLLFVVLRPDDVRRFFGRRQTRYGTTTLLAVLFFALIGILIYWIAYQNPDWRIDTTETGSFTPLPETVDLLKNLDEPIHVIGFFSPNAAVQQEQAADTLDSLSAYSDLFTYEFQDPESNPLLAENYDLNFDGTLVFIRNRGAENESFAKANSLNDNDIHAALVKAINPVEKKLYLLTGHGELDSQGFGPEGMGTAIGVAEDQGFTVEELNLFTAGSVPEDANVVALIGQQSPLDPSELAALQAYVDGGGSLFLTRDPVDSPERVAAEEDGINAWLQSAWGVTLRNDVIVDQDLAQAGQQFGLSFLADSYGLHPIIVSEMSRFGTRFDLARSIALAQENSAQVMTELVLTSASSWGETSFDLLSTGFAQPDGDDATGPLAVVISGDDTGSGARIVVAGDSDFITNQNQVWGGNSLLFTNALNWLANDELAIELSPRESIDRQVNIPQTQLTLLQITSVCLGPVIVGLIGLVVALSRRRRR